MLRNVLLIVLAGLVISCNEEQSFDPLKQPPYDKVTDSIRKEPNRADLYFQRGMLLRHNDQVVFATKDLCEGWGDL